MLKSTSLF